MFKSVPIFDEATHGHRGKLAQGNDFEDILYRVFKQVDRASKLCGSYTAVALAMNHAGAWTFSSLRSKSFKSAISAQLTYIIADANVVLSKVAMRTTNDITMLVSSENKKLSACVEKAFNETDFSMLHWFFLVFEDEKIIYTAYNDDIPLEPVYIDAVSEIIFTIWKEIYKMNLNRCYIRPCSRPWEPSANELLRIHRSQGTKGFLSGVFVAAEH
jgi:hypothetical protein